MPILWIAVYCLIAVGVLFALTFNSEMAEEKHRCDKLAKLPPPDGRTSKPDDLHRSA